MRPVIEVTSIHYPESDGRPMGETDEHRKEMIRQLELLARHFSGQEVYVSGNLLVYYEQGNPKKYVVPDVFVVRGVPPRDRRVYRLWVERKAPDVILEVTSRKTKRKDTVIKPALYAELKVSEYFLFDPTQDYLEPPLQGHRLREDRYEAIAPTEAGSLLSEQLGLRLTAERGQLVFHRLDDGARLLTAEEELRRESQARRAAEVELSQLREQLRRGSDE